MMLDLVPLFGRERLPERPVNGTETVEIGRLSLALEARRLIDHHEFLRRCSDGFEKPDLVVDHEVMDRQAHQETSAGSGLSIHRGDEVALVKIDIEGYALQVARRKLERRLWPGRCRDSAKLWSRAAPGFIRLASPQAMSRITKGPAKSSFSVRPRRSPTSRCET